MFGLTTAPFPYAQFEAEATPLIDEIMVGAHRRRDSRSMAQHRTDTTNGITLQFAVFHKLASHGYKVTMAPRADKWYDISLVENDITYYLDVKGRFHPNALSYTQSAAEHDLVKLQSKIVIYLCFDCRSGEAIYDGYYIDEFSKSMYNGGYYLQTNKLL